MVDTGSPPPGPSPAPELVQTQIKAPAGVVGLSVRLCLAAERSVMTWRIQCMPDPQAKSALCARLAAELPIWFGRPESNAAYASGMASRDGFAALVDETPQGLIALDYHFGVTCNVWWLGVRPRCHRRGVGRALVEHASRVASGRGCRQLAVETMSPRAHSPEYDLTRMFYEAAGFRPFVEFEPEPGDFMMWMIRDLLRDLERPQPFSQAWDQSCVNRLRERWS